MAADPPPGVMGGHWGGLRRSLGEGGAKWPPPPLGGDGGPLGVVGLLEGGWGGRRAIMGALGGLRAVVGGM